ncbi:hypothetical protein GCM10020358_81280 [Amorphoplanes nipponensis]|uniref:Uncharacterized protein n=1 Tax=Actinoplanes nipponensis TaxID=135950 RepID=A0A919JJ09_9ACTN|nr:hypothetical protein [Actinoplanes nipponensis]GIE47679.1 hypothetical protein Ani05nite_12130 [Actinoplanes nipponensis]
MVAPGNALIQVVFAIAFIVASGYALGRIHQWYRDGTERDEAYRSGYDRASDSMFGMALRRQAEEAAAAPPLLTGPPPAAEGPYGRPVVGHARRRIVATRLSCAAPGGAAH